MLRAFVWSAALCGCLAGELAAQPPPDVLVRVDGANNAPAKVFDVRPVYPDLARRARVEGVVVVEFALDRDGDVVNARVLRGVPLLNDAALDAVRQWKYAPTVVNGKAVPVVMTATVNFTLPDRELASANPFLVGPAHVGQLRLGMTAQDLYTRIPPAQVRLVPRRTERGMSTALEIVLEPGGPIALVANMEGMDIERISELDVRHEPFRTAEGWGIGTTLGELRQRDPGMRLMMCDRSPCVMMSTNFVTFVLESTMAPPANLAQLPDETRVTRILVTKPQLTMPAPAREPRP